MPNIYWPKLVMCPPLMRSGRDYSLKAKLSCYSQKNLDWMLSRPKQLTYTKLSQNVIPQIHAGTRCGGEQSQGIAPTLAV